jgi:hypothetical protein
MRIPWGGATHDLQFNEVGGAAVSRLTGESAVFYRPVEKLRGIQRRGFPNESTRTTHGYPLRG